jgi:uncharacterized protein YbjT (DUF2867 family)
MSEVTLVTGGTGNVGKALLGRLRFMEHPVRAASRDPEAAAQSLGVQAAEFDYEREETWDQALQGVARVFLCPIPSDAQADAHMNPFIDRAAAAGVQHIVLLTAQGVEHFPQAPLHKVEKHLMASGAAYTILRPTWFMQNFNPGMLHSTIVERNAIFAPAGDGETAFVDTRDIAHVAALSMVGEAHKGQAYTLTGPDALSYHDVADVISKVSGRIVRYVPMSDEDYRASLLEAGLAESAADYMLVIFRAVRAGHAAQISPDFEKVTGAPATSFRQFAEENAYSWK